MKTFLLLCLLVPFISSKVVDTVTEQFECIANYLRDKKLLEKGFRFFVQSEELECETFLMEMREVWLNQTIDGMFTHSESSEEDDEETKAFREVYLTNPNCFYHQLVDLNYADVIMKIFIYTKSNKLSVKQRKKFLANVETDNTKRILIASSICFPEALFGASFDEIFTPSKDENESEEDKQTDYCIRQFVVDNNFIDSFSIEPNLDNLVIAPDFNCTDLIDDAFEELEDQLKSPFLNDSEQSRRHIRCMNRVIRNAKAVNFMSRLSVLSELNLSDEVKDVERKKFIEFMSNLYKDMAKC